MKLARRLISPNLLLTSIVILAVTISGVLVADSAGIDVTAILVLGQKNFTSNTAAAGQAGLSDPHRIAIDTTVTPNHLYVADYGNNRVLGWNDASALTKGQPADLVIGQTDFTGSKADGGGSVSATTLYANAGLAVDADGNLWVADTGNNRVLEYNTPYEQFGHPCSVGDPCEGGLAANLVLGQGADGTTPPAFTTSAEGTSATAMNGPNDVAFDSKGTVYVPDGI